MHTELLQCLIFYYFKLKALTCEFLFQVPTSFYNLWLAMAYTTRTCFFFVLSVLSHELLFVEARNLKQSKDHLPNSAKDTKKSTVIASRPTRKLEVDVEAFRPTNPGHSPGIGHFIKT
ncbi:hypothetical protein K1719_015448 [Acacia pycnantha]|nr:hypothetical protein K1719_015448 [Acacia pycnantha]